MVNIKSIRVKLTIKDFDNFLSLLGYPPDARKYYSWRELVEEIEWFFDEEEYLEVERTLLGERVYQKSYNHTQPQDEDEMYDEYIDWKERKENKNENV